MTLLWKGAVINSMPKIFRKFHKGLALALSAAMCVSLSSVPAFAAETTEAVTSEDGRTTTITTEITWASPEGEEPVVEGAAVTTETTVLDEEGRVIQESGSETGHETVTTETVTSGTTVEDKEPVTETAEGETITTEAPGEFETVDSSAASSSTARSAPSRSARARSSRSGGTSRSSTWAWSSSRAYRRRARSPSRRTVSMMAETAADTSRRSSVRARISSGGVRPASIIRIIGMLLSAMPAPPAGGTAGRWTGA